MQNRVSKITHCGREIEIETPRTAGGAVARTPKVGVQNGRHLCIIFIYVILYKVIYHIRVWLIITWSHFKVISYIYIYNFYIKSYIIYEYDSLSRRQFKVDKQSRSDTQSQYYLEQWTLTLKWRHVIMSHTRIWNMTLYNFTYIKIMTLKWRHHNESYSYMIYDFI